MANIYLMQSGFPAAAGKRLTVSELHLESTSSTFSPQSALQCPPITYTVAHRWLKLMSIKFKRNFPTFLICKQHSCFA